MKFSISIKPHTLKLFLIKKKMNLEKILNCFCLIWWNMPCNVRSFDFVLVIGPNKLTNYGKETIKIKQNDFFFNMNFYRRNLVIYRVANLHDKHSINFLPSTCQCVNDWSNNFTLSYFNGRILRSKNIYNHFNVMKE